MRCEVGAWAAVAKALAEGLRRAETAEAHREAHAGGRAAVPRVAARMERSRVALKEEKAF